MASTTRTAQRRRPFWAPLIGLAGTGAILGFLQLLPAAGLEHTPSAAPRLALVLAGLTILYRLWRRLLALPTALGGGLVVGLAYFGVSLHFLGASANPDPSTFIWHEAVTTAGAMMLFVPWWGGWFLLARGLARAVQVPTLEPLAFVLAFAVSDLLLGDLVMGLPLAPLALFVLDTPLSGLVRLTGQLGSDLALVGVGAALGHWTSLAAELRDERPKHSAQPRLALGPSLSLVAVGACAWMGAPRGAAPTRDDASVGPVVHLVQPALPHPAFLPPDRAEEIVRQAILQGIQNGVRAGAQVIVLPEGALLDDLTASPSALATLAEQLPQGTVLVAGFKRAEVTSGPDGAFDVRPFNSVGLIGHQDAVGGKAEAADVGPGQLLRVMDKAHLVPIGEVLPPGFAALGFDVLAGPSGGYARGPQIAVVSELPGVAPFAVLICFEAVLTGAVSRETQSATWLLNISSETSFRGTVGPRFLLDHMRLRALESGRPMLRATAHAYSGLIGADGSLVALLPPEAASGITVEVPASRPTPFGRLGYAPFYGVLAAGLSVLGGAMATRLLRHSRARFLAKRPSNP